MERYEDVFDISKNQKQGGLIFPEQVGKIKDGWTIVFGGDSQDRGPGDIRFCLVMLMWKEMHPGRVHWVLGNRDGNKMRILYEMSDSSLKERMKEIDEFVKNGGKKEDWLPGPGFPWWLKLSIVQGFKNQRKTPYHYGVVPNGTGEFDFQALRVGMLKWILVETMGAPDAFEQRRKELQILRRQNGRIVSDVDVVDSFVGSVTNDKKDGNYAFDKDWLYEYLSRAHIMLRIGDMVFLHGGITPTSVLQLPEYQMQKIKRHLKDDEFNAWVSELEKFYKDGVAAFSRSSDGKTAKFESGFNPYNRYETRYGAGIVEYCAPYNAIPTSVVVNSYFDMSGNPENVEGGGWERVWSILRNGGIKYVFCGHRPRGDRGSVTGDKDGTVIVCSADNSHGGFKFSSVFRRDGMSHVHMYTRGYDESLSQVVLFDGETQTDVHELLEKSRELKLRLPAGSFLVDILQDKYLIFESIPGKVAPGRPNFTLRLMDVGTDNQSKKKQRHRLKPLPPVQTEKPAIGLGGSRSPMASPRPRRRRGS